MEKKLLTLFLALSLSVWLLSLAILLPCSSDKLMLSLMRHYAPAAQTGLPDSEYPAVVGMITDYLMGHADSFQHTFVMNGAEYLAFNQKEQQHMVDVQGLFLLATDVMQIGLAIAGLMLVGLVLPDLIWNTGLMSAMIFAVTDLRPQELGRSLRKGLLIVLGIVAAVAIWAAIDFDSLFILFHRVAFTNDLWLLDPRTDLLIRLMPTEFFVAYAAVIGAVWATGMGIVIFLTSLLTKERNA